MEAQGRRPFDVSLALYKKGQLEKLDGKPGMENFSATAKAAWQTDDGKDTFCMPMASVIHGFLYNKAIFAVKDPATGIRGWNQKADVGIQPVGRGLFYLAVNSGTKGSQSGSVRLHRWTGKPEAPFVPATAADLGNR